MSVKEDVFKFIEKNPEMSLDQIVNGLPNLKKASVRKYFYDYRKQKQEGASAKKAPAVNAAKRKKGASSIRKQVYGLLDANPAISIDDLCQAIDGCNRKTIRDYRNRWRKENENAPETNPAPSPKAGSADGDARDAVYSYMKRNPEANLNDLKKIFPNNGKLVTDFRSWKLQQSEKLKSVRKTAEEAVSSHLAVDSYKKTIDSLKQVIEKQKSTIETQRSKLKQIRAQLAEVPRLNLDSLKSFLAKKLLKK